MPRFTFTRWAKTYHLAHDPTTIHQFTRPIVAQICLDIDLESIAWAALHTEDSSWSQPIEEPLGTNPELVAHWSKPELAYD